MNLNEKKMKLISWVVLSSALFLSFFFPWEMGGESWGYWSFTKILNETGHFVNLDRSPLYTLYLLPFSLIPYPYSTYLEYLLSMLIVLLAMNIFLVTEIKNVFAALVGTIIWIPIFQSFEPPVQKLGLASVLFAFTLRNSNVFFKKYCIAYSLLILAYLLRPVYLFPLVFLILYDFVIQIQAIYRKEFVFNLKKTFSMLFVFSLLFLIQFTFSLNQIKDPWNNAMFGTSQWFPGGDDLFSIGLIQAISWHYIPIKYGTFDNYDFWQTQKELFGNAVTFTGMIQANPSFLVEFFVWNTIRLIRAVTWNFPNMGLVGYKDLFLRMVLIGLTVWGIFRFSKKRLFFQVKMLSLCVSAFICIINWPATRYMMPLTPLISLSAYYYFTSVKINRIAIKLIAGCFILVFFFFQPLFEWGRKLRQVGIDYFVDGQPKILTSRVRSMSSVHNELDKYVHGCSGIMSLEYSYLFAFFSIPREIIFDLWEIPPFGSLGKSEYKGLRRDRIDCLFISNGLETGIGMGTNQKLRYLNYIKPYADYLLSQGAMVSNINGYGKVIFFEQENR